MYVGQGFSQALKIRRFDDTKNEQHCAKMKVTHVGFRSKEFLTGATLSLVKWNLLTYKMHLLG